jgi:hypothetical protein
LQIGLEHYINKTSNEHAWEVLYREHSWKNAETKRSGFIDLVLTDRSGTSVMVVECKRVQNTNWIFLLPSENQMSRRQARGWVSRFSNGRIRYFDWTDIIVGPSTPESAFCVVPGQDQKSRPMLERVSTELIEATEALAKEEAYLFESKTGDHNRTYISIIVTTAEISLCRFDPETVSIDTGMVEDTEFHTVHCLRFRKSLSTKTVEELNLSEMTHYNLTRAKENTVFIVNSNYIVDFLRNIAVHGHTF